VKPSYQSFSPTFGELAWTASPSDALLSVQLAYLTYIQQAWGDELLDCRQGFTRISLYWKSPAEQHRFSEAIASLDLPALPLSNRIWEIPVCYSPEFGTDLSNLARQKNRTETELIQLHSQALYRIHFFGFLPGFFYLNGLDPSLHTPRKSIPSARVPKGSVAIGGSQTGIYPKESPGGWHLLGQTPLSLFNSQKERPVWGTAGERIKFVPIDLSQFMDWKAEQPSLYQP
jgi:KipI family sensor histidine kinase inhibitor